MATKKKLKASDPKAPKMAVPDVVDWNALRKTAAFLEKAKLAEYIDMMNHPWRSIWLNFMSGMARGVGIVLGGSVVGVVLVVLILAALKTAFEHAGGMPIVGEYVKQAIGWILEIVNQKKGGA